MKITPFQYASALQQALAETKKEEREKIVANFLKVLQKNKHSKLLPFILDKLEKITAKKNKILKLEIVTAQEVSQEELAKSFQKAFPGYDLKIIQRVDPRLKGGLIVRYNDTVIDNSWQRKISSLKEALLK